MMKFFKILVVIIVLLSFALFVRATDLDKVTQSLQQVGWRFFILIGVTFFAYYLGTVGWRYCMKPPFNKLGLFNLFMVRHIGEMVSIVNPTSIVGGEAVKLYLLSDTNIDRKTVVVSILTSRILMVVTQLMLFFAAVGLLLFYHVDFDFNLPDIPRWLAMLLLAILAFSVFVSYNRRAILRAVKNRGGGRVYNYLRKLKIKWVELRSAFTGFFSSYPKAVLMSTLFFILHWIFGSLEFYFILKFLGVEATVTQALLVDMGVIFFKAAGAFVPAQIGVEEYGNKIMLQAIGVPGVDVWLTASLLRRARQIFWLAFGLLIYFIMYRKNKMPAVA